VSQRQIVRGVLQSSEWCPFDIRSIRRSFTSSQFPHHHNPAHSIPSQQHPFPRYPQFQHTLIHESKYDIDESSERPREVINSNNTVSVSFLSTLPSCPDFEDIDY
jgi:hypothetical protein